MRQTLLTTFQVYRGRSVRGHDVRRRQTGHRRCDELHEWLLRLLQAAAAARLPILANLWQIADPITGLSGSACNGTNTTCTPPYAPEGQVAVGECQVLGRTTSVKYSYWDLG